jgi:rubrerythrin
MNVFDFAIQMEEDGRKFYEKLAEEASEPELKSIFRLLADEERKHRDIFQAMKNGEDPANADSKNLVKVKSAFQKLLDKKDTLSILRQDPDGYRHSIKTEEEYIKLYEDLAKKEKNEHTAKLLLKIAEEERQHLSIMENIFDFVESPKTFLAWGEFSNLEEL